MIIRREDFGDITKLTKGSHKKIWFTCDACGIGVLQKWPTYLNQNDGKFCRKCRNKHTANRSDVKKKHSENGKNMWKNPEYRKNMGKKLSVACKKAWDNDDGTRRKWFSENNPMKNPEVAKKIGKLHKDKIVSEKTRKRISDNHARIGGEDHPAWKGGGEYAPFDTFAHQIDYAEKVRNNDGRLEITCTYCGRWYIPKRADVVNRVGSLNGDYTGEHRFYCSEGCKKSCPIYRKTPEMLMKEDAVRAGRLTWLELPREVQPELRKMVFARDNYTCQNPECGKTESLHCHHKEGIRWEPLESADIDMCITFCKDCHKAVHKKEGCGYHEMQCK